MELKGKEPGLGVSPTSSIIFGDKRTLFKQLKNNKTKQKELMFNFIKKDGKREIKKDPLLVTYTCSSLKIIRN
jgi:hypothetical protein